MRIGPPIAILVAASLAGCIGGGDASESASEEEETDSFGFGAEGNVTAGNSTSGSFNGTASANGTDGPSYETEERTGSVSGLEYDVDGATSEETFTVPNGTVYLEFNLTVEGSELDMYVRGPDCEDDSCASVESTSGGEAQYTETIPASGEYTIVLRGSEVGMTDADYTLVGGFEVEVDA